MEGEYLGTLERADPLYGYIVKDVMPQVDLDVKDPVFHVSRMRASNLVYKYREERTDVSLIGKFYGSREPYKARRLAAEFENLRKTRALGMSSLPNYVVRPFGQDSSMGLGLLEEYVPGKDLDHYIKRAVYDKRHDRLMERLTDLAGFMSALHRRTEIPIGLDLAPSVGYFEKLLAKLRKKGLIDDSGVKRFRMLKEAWKEREYMEDDTEVVIHGDATPTNFIFPRQAGVIAIDLERMKPGDRMFDVGMVCGELKHAFMWRMGDRYASEPHIGHFISEYVKGLGGGGETYRSVVRRNPFFMAVTELRIARNNWLDRAHRARLVREAEQCLTWGLKLR